MIAMTRSPLNRLSARRGIRGFTLIEMLVVIVIIAILIGAVVAIGAQVRAQATRRATLAELRVLDGAMKDYLAAGNAEPAICSTTPPPTVTWPYGTNPPAAYVRTTPESDVYNWVIALKSTPDTAKKIAGFSFDTDVAASPTNGTHATLLDAYGTAIRYIPSQAATANTPAKEGYFMSAGPDGRFSMQNPPTTASKAYRPDEIYSTDPQ